MNVCVKYRLTLLEKERAELGEKPEEELEDLISIYEHIGSLFNVAGV